MKKFTTSLFLLFSLEISGEVIEIPPGNVSSSSEIGGSFNRQDDFIVDGSGLSGGQHTSAVQPNMWLSTGTSFGGNDLDPFVLFDLGEVYTITAIQVWNYNESPPLLTARGVNAVSLEYGETEALGSVVAEVTNFAEASGSNSYEGERFESFAPFAARFIKFDIDSNHGGDNQFYGLSEVRFEGVLAGIEISNGAFLTSDPQGSVVGTLTTLSGGGGAPFHYSLVAGEGDLDNGKFQIVDDELQLGSFDFLATGDGEVFSVRVRSEEGPGGGGLEKVFSITARADADGDGLLDSWEERWAGVDNLALLSGLGGANEDNDGLTDLQEYELREQFPDLNPTSPDSDNDTLNDDQELLGAGERPATDPTLADTDGDSLPDGVESNTGVYASVSDTGTNPVVVDSDGDTLNDGVETNSGELVGPTNTGSDPNRADTDGDGFNDNIEVVRGSDPSDGSSVPPTPQVGLDRPASGSDAVVVFHEINYHPTDAGETGEWVELFNQMGIKTDISGWRLDGVGYVFPEGTVMEPGGYLVVAKSPLAGQTGPFPGSLNNGGERLRLINRGDRLMDEVDYRDRGRWPVEADGSGATLAKIRPYLPSGDPKNWRASEESGGTPGVVNFVVGTPEPGLVINELPAAGALNFWVELENIGPDSIDLAEMVLMANFDPDRVYFFPGGSLAPGARLLLDEGTLGFRALDGDRIFLLQGGRVLDGQRLTGSNRGLVPGRAEGWLYPSAPTPDAPNLFSFQEGIVISEIAYNPPAALPESTASENQWIEIANRGASEVDLTGWFFDDGVDFVFPPGTILAAGEHACLARDEVLFGAAYPGARLLGGFGGRLSRSGERLLLCDDRKNPVDEVHYFESGRWPEAADGGGSTLELRDLDADNATAGAWAASDEFSQTSWQTYRYRAVAQSDGGPTEWQEFNMGLLDSGVILLDDISVVEDPDGAAVEMLSNRDFESGATSWRLRGNHGDSEVISDPDGGTNKVLRVVASGVTEHMHNQIETTLADGRSVVNGREYEISYRARWVTGTSLFHTRLYFSRAARATVIDRPVVVGTPSAANSQAEVNIGPTVHDLLHAPAVPGAGETITITARAEDPDGVADLVLNYSVNGAAFQTRPMSENPNCFFEGTIPGQDGAAVVQFYLEATDGMGGVSMFPLRGPDSRALIKVDDGLAATNGLHNFRVVMTNDDRDLMYNTNIEVMSNDRLGATVIDREEEIYYDVGVRLKGSQRARAYQPRVGLNLRFGADQLYRGAHQSMAIDRSEGTGSGQFELLFDLMMANSGGVISRYYDLIQVITPTGSTHTRPAVLQMARYDDVFLDSQFENGSDGNLYEYDFVYYPRNTDGAGNKIPQGDGISSLAIRDQGDDKERYRFYLLKKNNRDGDDFGPIIAYCKQMSKSGLAFSETVDEIVDVDSWLRGMAYGVLSGAGDNTAAGTLHNGMYYARPDGRIIYFPHDMDFAFSNTRSVFANLEARKLANTPSIPGNEQRRRIYFGHLHDIITTTWNGDYMGMWQSHLGELSPDQNWERPNSGSYTVAGRSANVLSQIAGDIPEVEFEITTPSPLVVSTGSAEVSGDGWINVREIRVLGGSGPLAVTWTDEDSWQVNVPVRPGVQSQTLQAFDFSGNLIGGEVIVIENTSPVEPASAANLVISELMYHPRDPDAQEIDEGILDSDQFEFVELMNIGLAAVDLAGASFTAGINHVLPAIILEPGERVVLARSRDAFLSRHPAAATVLLEGEYLGANDTNQLSNGGEEVVLSDAFGNVIRRFTYSDDFPWPEGADGVGFSLSLIAPERNPDHQIFSNWRRSLLAGGTPGGSDAGMFAGDAEADGDSDELSLLMEYALGSSDALFNQAGEISMDGTGHLIFEYPQNLVADDVVLEAQRSPDLNTWVPLEGGFFLERGQPIQNGIQKLRWRSLLPQSERAEFLRLRVRFRD